MAVDDSSNEIELIDEEWRYVLLVGLTSIPVSLVLYWYSDGYSHPFAPVFIAGIVLGVLSEARGWRPHTVGARVGLIGALPALWPFFDLLLFALETSQPVGGTVLQLVALVFVLGVLVGFSVFVGTVGAIAGNLVSKTV